MIIQRISENKMANNLYIFNNNNYSQVKRTPVTPVKSIKKLSGAEGREDNSKSAAVYQHGEGNELEIKASGTKQIDAIKNEYSSSDKVSYDINNVYERQRMATEGTVLLGMNFDMLA